MKTRNTLLFALLSATIFSGCDSGGDSGNLIDPIVKVDAKYQGYWTAPGYGLSLAIDEASIHLYQHTSEYCMLANQEDEITTSDIEEILTLSDTADTLEWFQGLTTPDIGLPGIVYQRENQLPNSCQAAVISLVDNNYNELNSQENYRLFAQIFEEYYVDFERNQVAWPEVVYQAGLAINTSTNEEGLFTAMAATLEPLQDGHNYLQTPSGYYAKTLSKPTLIQRLIEEYAIINGLDFPIPEELFTNTLINEINTYVEENLELQWDIVNDYASDDFPMQSAANGLIRWSMSEDIGYLYIGGMIGYSNADQDATDYLAQELTALNNALNTALADLQNSTGLIVDVRTNDGGMDAISVAIASRFTHFDFHAFSKQARDGNGRTPLFDVLIEPSDEITFTGPIALLTSSSTVSAAETFTLAMRQLDHVTIIGEPSHGAFSNVLEWQLPNGFQIGLSNEFYLSAQNEWFEGAGVPVDIYVPFFTLEDREAARDAAIETAFTYLNL